jgi:hypothetical protein
VTKGAWQMFLGAFRPQSTAEDKKSHPRAYPDFLLHRSHRAVVADEMAEP